MTGASKNVSEEHQNPYVTRLKENTKIPSNATQAKKALLSTSESQQRVNTRKRRALGDVSNTNAPTNDAVLGQSKNISGLSRKAAVPASKAEETKKVLLQKKQPITKSKVPVLDNVKKDVKALEERNPENRPVRSAAVAAARKLSGLLEKDSLLKSNQCNGDQSQAGSRKRQKTNEKSAEDAAKEAPVERYWDDLDADDKFDPLMVSEYVVEIFEYLRELEKSTLPDPNYMSRQKHLQWKMRTILVDWLVEVHLKFKLLPETLFLTINIMDRFLSLRTVSLGKFQLVGITAMFIASKYEEVYAPSISQFVYISDGGFSHDEIIRAERYMLQVLEFKLQYPNPLNFLRRCSKADGYDIHTRTIAKYLMEICILDECFLAHGPSMIAASAMYLARAIVEQEPVVDSQEVWNNNLRYFSGYEDHEMKQCITRMLNFLCGVKIEKYASVYNKYTNSKFFGTSLFVGKWVRMQRKKDCWGLKLLMEEEKRSSETSPEASDSLASGNTSFTSAVESSIEKKTYADGTSVSSEEKYESCVRVNISRKTENNKASENNNNNKLDDDSDGHDETDSLFDDYDADDLDEEEYY